jgi:hypothetical protein
MASLEEKQIAKEIMIAYIGRGGHDPFSMLIAKEIQFESVWDRVIKMVSDQYSAPASPAN